MMMLAIVLLVGAVLLGAWAQHAVVRRYQQYAAVPNGAGISGAEAARAILKAHGIEDVHIEAVPGPLADHFDPRRRRLGLSHSVHDGRSVAALAIASHEAGHALQEASQYGPLALRRLAVPSARFGSLIGLPLLLIGALLHQPLLALLGFLFYAGVVLLQLLTLPVEIDASRRALAALEGMHLINPGAEQEGIHAVLAAAALTYVAASLAAVAGLLYDGLFLFGGRRH